MSSHDKTQFDRWMATFADSAANRSRIIPSSADKANLPFVDYSGMKLKPGDRSTPHWLQEEGLCFVGCWEILAWRRHSCIATNWVEEEYAFEHSQAFIDDIKALGCNAVVLPYDCSHGEAFNEKQVQATKTFIALLHANGLKAGTYFRPDISWTETLSAEELAELNASYQVDYNGRPMQPFGSAARNICYHHRGALNRFKRHVERAIVDLMSDILHLDGMIVGGHEGEGCRCPQCRADFRAYLMHKYGDDRDLAESRFGHPFMEKVEPPDMRAPFDAGASRPHWCEWIAFRCHWTSHILSEVAALARELNPEVMIEINNALPAVRENAALMTGQDVIGTGFYTDASWSEDGYGPRMHENGLLTHRVRQFKLCRAADTFALTYMHEENERELRQNLAHTAAFNFGNIGCIGFPPQMNFSNRYNVHFDTKCRFMCWMNENRHYFTGLASDARIAVWRARESMAVSSRLTYAATMRMEQLLIETCRGFDLVFEEDPAALARYELLILPNLECMSLHQIEGLMAYVENGGSLLVGQDSAQYDLWHRRRIESPWAALFGDASRRTVAADAVANGIAGEFVAAGTQASVSSPVRMEYGNGRAAYIPQIVDPAAQPSLTNPDGSLSCALDYTNWRVPECADTLDETLDWLLENREQRRVSAQRGMLAEFLAQPDKQRTLVHLVNLCPAPQRGCSVTLDRAWAPDTVTILHPPTDKAPTWRVEEAGGRTCVVFDTLDVYAVVAVQEA